MEIPESDLFYSFDRVSAGQFFFHCYSMKGNVLAYLEGFSPTGVEMEGKTISQ